MGRKGKSEEERRRGEREVRMKAPARREMRGEGGQRGERDKE